MRTVINSSLAEKVKSIAKEKEYGREEFHINHVLRYSVDIYTNLVKYNLIEDNNRNLELLMSACYLHDVGVNVSDGDLGLKILPEEDHNLKSFKWCNIRLNMSDCNGLLTDSEKSIVSYCTLWHKGDAWQLKPELKIDWNSLVRARLIASILRVGDSLSSAFEKISPHISDPEISITVLDNKIYIEILPSNSGEVVDANLKKADNRKDLFEAVMKAVSLKKIDGVIIRIAKS
jgi:hypothetical protein